jgi:hypothetical protein
VRPPAPWCGVSIGSIRLALQTVLLGAAGGSASTDPWQLGIPANAIAVVVCDLAAALLWPAWLGLGSMHARDTIAVARDQLSRPCGRGSRMSCSVPSLFTAVADGSRLRTLTGQIEGVAPSGAAIDLTWFIRRLPTDEQ